MAAKLKEALSGFSWSKPVLENMAKLVPSQAPSDPADSPLTIDTAPGGSQADIRSHNNEELHRALSPALASPGTPSAFKCAAAAY